MSSREEAQALRVQMEEQKEKARKDVQEAQRHGNDAQRELDQSHMTLRRLEEEVGGSFLSARLLNRCMNARRELLKDVAFKSDKRDKLTFVSVGESEQISRQKKELMVTCEERDNHQLDRELLTNRLRHLEGEIEASKNSYNEKTREIRILEVDYLLTWGPKPNISWCLCRITCG